MQDHCLLYCDRCIVGPSLVAVLYCIVFVPYTPHHCIMYSVTHLLISCCSFCETVWGLLSTVQYCNAPMYTVHLRCTLSTARCTLHTIQCTMNTEHFTLYTAHCTLLNAEPHIPEVKHCLTFPHTKLHCSTSLCIDTHNSFLHIATLSIIM